MRMGNVEIDIPVHNEKTDTRKVETSVGKRWPCLVSNGEKVLYWLKVGYVRQVPKSGLLRDNNYN